MGIRQRAKTGLREVGLAEGQHELGRPHQEELDDPIAAVAALVILAKNPALASGSAGRKRRCAERRNGVRE